MSSTLDFSTDDYFKFIEHYKVGGPDECWIWTGGTDGSYSQFYWGRHHQSAHRIMFFLRNGFLPGKGKHVHHTCENKLCVNPNHLMALTHSEHARLHRKGKKDGPLSEEHKATLRAANLGKTPSTATRQKLRVAAIRRAARMTPEERTQLFEKVRDYNIKRWAQATVEEKSLHGRRMRRAQLLKKQTTQASPAY